MNTKNILILGAGVSGLTTAIALLQAGHKVTIWSKEKDGQLPATSANAYAMWVPVKIDADPRIENWAKHSFAEFEKLSHEADTGVALRRILTLKTIAEEPWYAQSTTGFRHASQAEIPNGYTDGHVLEAAPVIDPPIYLLWLRKQFLDLGGTLKCRKVQKFSQCPRKYSIVINCTGLGAAKLAGDIGVYPEHVQVVTVKQQGVDQVVIDDEGPNKRACIVPHDNYIKLGAVFNGDAESLEVNDEVTEDILKRCSGLISGFKPVLADVISVTCALRPERALPRVEIEQTSHGRTIIHNYGHDGMGYILSHGIAREIASYLI